MTASLMLCVHCEGERDGDRQKETDSAYHSVLSGCPWAAPSLISISVCSRVADCWEEAGTQREEEQMHRRNPSACCCMSLIIQSFLCSGQLLTSLYTCLDCDLYMQYLPVDV